MIKLTKEQRKISDANHKKAAEFFKLQKGWVLHHIDPSWRHNDIERYIQWNIEDLVMMTNEEHTRLHKKGCHHSEETKDKISQYNKTHGIKPPSQKGKHWYTNGVINKLCATCPDGFVPGQVR